MLYYIINASLLLNNKYIDTYASGAVSSPLIISIYYLNTTYLLISLFQNVLFWYRDGTNRT